MRFNHIFKKRNPPPLLKTFHTRCRFAPLHPPIRPLQGIAPIQKTPVLSIPSDKPSIIQRQTLPLFLPPDQPQVPHRSHHREILEPTWRNP